MEGDNGSLGATPDAVHHRLRTGMGGFTMAEVKPLDWPDIGWHCLIAGAWAGLCGYVTGWAYIYATAAPGLPDEVLGWALAGVFTLAGILGDWLFWAARERKQHRYSWGGRQSQWELLAPAGVTVVAFGAGVAIAILIPG